MDDEVSDEMLIDELEALVNLDSDRVQTWEDDITTPTPCPNGTPVVADGSAPPTSPSQAESKIEAAKWTSARSALLVCRELVRTERSYLTGLRDVQARLAASTSDYIVAHLSALIQASERLLSQVEQNPSAKGVAQAFLDAEQDIEAAFVGWCSVVGQFFDGEEGMSVAQPEECVSGHIKTSQRLRRRVNSLVSLVDSFRSRESGPAMRELAILPVQRIVRYPLLFKSLSAAPESSTEPDIQKASDLALDLAHKCDMAQRTVTFVQEVPSDSDAL
ncbi:hypothetical protein CYLTODRAFT_239008 [Cylindrobasidium torrendii FP15055 ss-10]|uniref:DH domain-containing protein n=1 Tax=Cylindrobasidium torrendii FP15055 ss-10 TaxID=1314674 RepID=A0A0D7BS28_9AGAR|nr:hypothetical protein CYLTODRAFT_239008 [Cylindrobasidium torrendii FP15055 ss-10]